MMNEEILKTISPCGISCEKCFANRNGKIKEHSEALKHYLGNFDVYAGRFVDLLEEPKFKNYFEFKELLDLLSLGSCNGCRVEQCQLYSDCKVRDCYKEKGVDFCFQCNEFPCNHSGFDEHLEKRWIDIGLKLQKEGVEKYYQDTEGESRY